MSGLPAILTPRQLADALAVSDSQIRAMIRRGEIPEAFRHGPKLWRIHASALTRLAPKPDTLPDRWQDADAPQSQSQSAPKAAADGASDGAKPGANAKNAATTRKRKRSTGQTRSASAFARDFPEHASIVRSAS